MGGDGDNFKLHGVETVTYFGTSAGRVILGAFSSSSGDTVERVRLPERSIMRPGLLRNVLFTVDLGVVKTKLSFAFTLCC